MTDALVALAKGDRATAAALAQKAAVLAPSLINSGDPVLLAAFARSGNAALREMGRRAAQRLLATDAGHPRTLLDLAVLERQDGHLDEATTLLTRLLGGGQATPEIERAAAALKADIGDEAGEESF